MYTIVGLGNPGEEYKNTRHSVGRMALEKIRDNFDLPDWQNNKKSQALVSSGEIDKQKVTLVMPETFMNKSGVSAVAFVKNQSAIKKLIVIYDDLDLPIGNIKISFNRSSGGHKGVESIIKALKSQEFVRIRVGISPVTAGGRTKKPSGDEAVAKFILGKFKPAEEKEIKKVLSKIPDAVSAIMSEGHQLAMGKFN